MALPARGSFPSTVTQARSGLRERTGDAIGRLVAPVFAATSRLRRARTFHPVGHCFAGTCEPVEGRFAELASRLDGRVLARCSAALWKRDFEYLDVLGISLRFRRGSGLELDEHAEPGDQDLLFATVRSPLTLLAAPLFTNAHDFVSNRYWAVSPFAFESLRIELRLTPLDPPRRAGAPLTRRARLYEAVAAGRAAWWLEARRTLRPCWYRVARIALVHPVDVDQAALRFDPFRSGAGLEPVGLVHAIRRAVYAASQAAR